MVYYGRMGCEGGPKAGVVEGAPGIRRIAAFRRVESSRGEVRSETLIPHGDGLIIASTTPVRRLDRNFSGGSALEPSPVGANRFHQTPQIPIFESPRTEGI